MAHPSWIVKSIGWMDRSAGGGPDPACCNGNS
jgi:hypothetical protein